MALGALQFLAIITHLIYSPCTKVEESFYVQATHDILRYGLATGNVISSLRQTTITSLSLAWFRVPSSVLWSLRG
jgi:hypothetical protein